LVALAVTGPVSKTVLGLEGGAIFINASGLSDKAELTFEILDSEFHTIPGYTAKECVLNRTSGFTRQ
jgi:hypothetical protein